MASEDSVEVPPIGADLRLRAIESVVPALAHRLNNGLMAVVGLGELVLNNPQSPAVTRLAGTADDQGRRVVRSVKALSELVKPLAMEVDSTDIGPMIESAELLLEPLAEAYGTTFEVRAPSEIPTRAEGRAVLQWIVTVGSLALAATERSLLLRVRRSGSEWQIDLRGSFGDVELSETSSVAIRSRGRFGRARLRLPAFGEESEATTAASTGAKARILIVERDDSLAELVEAVLSEGGYVAQRVSDLDGALEVARSTEIQLVLFGAHTSPRWQLDLIETAERMRDSTPAAIGVVGSQALADSVGVARGLVPEFRPGELLGYVSELLG